MVTLWSSQHSRGFTATFLSGLVLATAVCQGQAVIPVKGDPLTSDGNVSRTLLSYDELMAARDAISPLNDAAFALPANAAMPHDTFEGRLDLLAPETHGDGSIVSSVFDAQLKQYPVWKHLPVFSVELVQNGSHLIPVKQGLLITGSIIWNLILGPGRVWSEKGDHGYSRASLPFSLAERSQNCVHNGSMTFLFSNTMKVPISQVRYQITQETCAYMKVDLWGQTPATYTPEKIADSASIKNAQAEEFALRVPTKPLSALTTDFPGSGFNVAALLSGRKHPEDVTTYGVYLNGVNYVSNCPTRYGEYAFCGEMRLPSYSTAKSAFAGMAMMHLGELYGKDVYSQKLQDYLPQVGQGDSWANVTFNDAINMATGHILTSGYEQDEDGPVEVKFLGMEKYDEKMKHALVAFPFSMPPGIFWSYQSHNTFLVTQAMTAYLQKKRGPDADLFNMVRDELYKPLHISQGMLKTIRTDDSDQGKPDGYFGLYFIQDDVVKIADFLNRGNGVLNGKQILDPQRLRESLFRDPSTHGLVALNPDRRPDTLFYNHAFWAKHFTVAEYPANKCDFWAPYMSGYGGISIFMLPNNAVFYIFSDHTEFIWDDAVNEINKLAPYCSAGH